MEHWSLGSQTSFKCRFGKFIWWRFQSIQELLLILRSSTQCLCSFDPEHPYTLWFTSIYFILYRASIYFMVILIIAGSSFFDYTQCRALWEIHLKKYILRNTVDSSTIDKPARLIIRFVFGFCLIVSDCDLLSQVWRSISFQIERRWHCLEEGAVAEEADLPDPERYLKDLQ